MATLTPATLNPAQRLAAARHLRITRSLQRYAQMARDQRETAGDEAAQS